MLKVICTRLALLATLYNNTAEAQQQAKQHFNIPAQSLQSALNQFSEDADMQMSYPAQLSKGINTKGISGDYTPEDALNQLLSGSGLAPRVANKTVTLEKAHGKNVLAEAPNKPKPAQKSGTTTLAPVMVIGNAIDDDPTAYNVTHSSSALRTDTPLMETPFSVQVVPQQILRDQQDIHIDKALNNVSGVYTGDSTGQGPLFVIRGFTGFGDEALRDGYKDQQNNSRELANIEQVEVLKGPSSILNGRVGPGGAINYVTKKPLDIPYYALQQQFGSYDLYRTSMDATAPLTQSKDLSYRLNMSYETAGSFREFVDRNSVFVAPVLRWDVSDKTQLNFELEYLHAREPLDTAAVFLNGQPLNRTRNLSGPGNEQTTDKVLVGTYWSHAFNDQWTLRGRFDYIDSDEGAPPQAFFAGIDPITCTSINCTGSLILITNPSNYRKYNSALNLTGHFDTWGLRHTLYMGGDYNHRDIDSSFAGNFAPTQFNIFGPIPSVDLSALNSPDFSQRSKFTYDAVGVSFQDQIKLPYNVHVLGGFRYDNFGQDTVTQNLVPAAPTTHTSAPEDKVTPRFGLLWQPLPELSVYGNYAENFGAGNFNTVTGTVLPPETAQQKEVGIKTELLDKRLIGSVAWFDITKQNVATPDSNPARAALGSLTATGEVRNKGLEVDVSGEILPGLKLIGAYSYIDSKITKDRGLDFNNLDADGNPTITIGNQGKRFWGTPKNGGSVWTTYEFQEGDLRGLKFGGGVVIRSQVTNLNLDNTTAPGYAKVNLMASYEWKIGKSRLTTQLNVDNLLDKETFTAGNRGFSFGTPRTMLGRCDWSIKLDKGGLHTQHHQRLVSGITSMVSTLNSMEKAKSTRY